MHFWHNVSKILKIRMLTKFIFKKIFYEFFLINFAM